MADPDGPPESSPRRDRSLDRDNLPEEFTPEFLDDLLPRDAVWLERNAKKLTARQRETFSAWSEDKFGYIARALKGSLPPPNSSLLDTLFGRSAADRAAKDRLGEEIRKSAEQLLETVTERQVEDSMSMTDEFRVEVNGQDVSEHPVDLAAKELAQMRGLLATLVLRTEQQYVEAQRQKTTNWLLACIAAASMVGTFFTIQGSTNIWIAVIVAIAIGAGLYLVMHDSGPSDGAGDNDDTPGGSTTDGS